MRYVFIINPVAGKGNAEQTVVPMVEQYFADNTADYKIYVTSQAGQAKTYADSEASVGDDVTVFACGGEGTCFEVLNGIVAHPNAVFGIIPCGSANDFLKLFDSAESFLDLESQLGGECTAIDLIKCDDEYCFNVCSVGIDAIIARDMSIFKNWKFVSGSMAYKLALVKNFLFSRLGEHLNITLDGAKTTEGDFLFAVCANGCTYGGGYMPAPKASPEDERLDFALVKKINRFRILPFIKDYEKGDIDGYDYVTTGNCMVMNIESKKAIPVNRDGEIIMKQNVRFELARRAVRLLVPNGAVKKYEEFFNFAKNT